MSAVPPGNPLDDVFLVGPDKPMGYIELVYYPSRRIDEANTLAVIARAGNRAFTTRSPMNPAPNRQIYAYNQKALDAHLQLNSATLQAARWPSDSENFARQCAAQRVHRRTPLYRVISQAFADGRFPPSSIILDPANARRPQGIMDAPPMSRGYVARLEIRPRGHRLELAIDAQPVGVEGAERRTHTFRLPPSLHLLSGDEMHYSRANAETVGPGRRRSLVVDAEILLPSTPTDSDDLAMVRWQLATGLSVGSGSRDDLHALVESAVTIGTRSGAFGAPFTPYPVSAHQPGWNRGVDLRGLGFSSRQSADGLVL